MDTKELIENLDARPYKCYHCHNILGVTTDYVLFVGAIRHKLHVTFECGFCDKTTFWKPKDEIIKKKNK